MSEKPVLSDGSWMSTHADPSTSVNEPVAAGSRPMPLNWSAARNCVDDPNDPFDDCSLSGLSSAFWGGMALGFGVPGLLLLGGGGASLGVGLGRRNKLLKPTSTGNLRLMPHGTLAPYAGPEGGGAAFTLRF